MSCLRVSDVKTYIANYPFGRFVKLYYIMSWQGHPALQNKGRATRGLRT
ncbi:hypothetical protein EMIT0158MI4_40099 [Burkholderia ambifaria]